MVWPFTILALPVLASAASPLPWGGGLAARCEWAARQRNGEAGACVHLPVAPIVAADASTRAVHPGVPNCEEKFFNQTIDHFSFTEPDQGLASYMQRYFIDDQFWKKPNTPDDPFGGPIFFYTGNEANVELYVNATGLIWENCAAFQCLVVFAEHRYWGKSLMPWDPPSSSGTTSKDLRFLTHEQALADYATLLYSLRKELGAEKTPTIAFGGSYGGMLAYWLRQKYPGAVDGAIAASAPVLAFKGQSPAFDSESYWAVVTRDATAAAGSTAECASGVRKGWGALARVGATAAGKASLQSLFSLCKPITTDGELAALVDLLWFAIDTMAMGDYPYPSNYLTNGGPLLAAFPMRTGCAAFAGHASGTASDTTILNALGRMAAVFNNATGELQVRARAHSGWIVASYGFVVAIFTNT